MTKNKLKRAYTIWTIKNAVPAMIKTSIVFTLVLSAVFISVCEDDTKENMRDCFVSVIKSVN